MPGETTTTPPPAGFVALLYHYCRMQVPALALSLETVQTHLLRTFALFQVKRPEADWPAYLTNLHAFDWYLAIACLEKRQRAWELLFAAHTGRTDCLLVDALRARAVRLYPRDEERQEDAVTEFWSLLLVSEKAETIPVLARFDGQRPLIPWLIRVFQNWHISQLRRQAGARPLPDEEMAEPLPTVANEADGRWHEVFREEAREALESLSDTEQLILGLRLRYRLSQREVAGLLGVHEGTVSRQTTQLRDRCLDFIHQRLLARGWLGDDLSELVRNEMAGVILDQPKLSAERLGKLLAQRGRHLPSA